ncbi:MAG: PH domain-containing protein [Sedimentisphaerales bacterium]|jgi:hypothetical protein
MEAEQQINNANITFSAPWSLTLKLVTVLTAILLIGIGLFGIFSGLYIKTLRILWFIGIVIQPFSILIIASFFMIRGYVITQNTLLIKRLFWNTKLDLTTLLSVEIDTQGLKRSIRACGNGGLFCFAGLFWNKRIGSYRAFATSPKLSVILKFPKRTVVVTPDRPEKFTSILKELRNL